MFLNRFHFQIEFKEIIGMRYNGKGDPAVVYFYENPDGVEIGAEIFDWDDFDIHFC